MLPTKKRNKEEPVSRLDCSSTNYSAEIKECKILVDFVLAHAKDDTRPYLEVEVYGTKFLGLLDSGSSRTIIGKLGWNRLRGLSLSITSDTIQFCTVANGEKCEVLGSLTIPIRLYDRVRLLEVLIVPSLPHDLILGMDFWTKMAIVPDLYADVWKFRDTDSDKEDDRIFAIQSKEHLTEVQKQILEELIEKNFSLMGTKLGCTSMVEHVITTEANPIKQRHYSVSPAVQKQINVELDQMLADGIVEPSNSPWASPIILVKKTDGKYRFCVDFRELNRVTKRDAYPLPFVSTTLEKLREAHYLTTLDIKSAYWQIPLSKESKPMTAFVVPTRGLFQFTRMPFGLHNAPATWQRFIDRVVGVDLEQYVLVYLDDIVICTPSFSKHIEVLNFVLERLRNAGLTLNREKCKFCVPELKYLGYVVNASGLLVDPEKVDAILRIPIPKNVSEVRRIVGLASWYRRFVPNLSTLIAPMTNLLRKNTPFIWNSDCNSALEAVKTHLTTAPILTCPNFDLPFVVQTDASDFGLGCVLTQVQQGEEKVISYLSRSLTKSERRFSTVEKECLAVLFAVEKLRPYLQGSHFTVITDHYSLKWLYSIKDPMGRIARWCIRLQQYDFDVIHRPGKDNVIADTLSRAVPIIDSIAEDRNDDAGEVEDKWYRSMSVKIRQDPIKYPSWRLESNKLYKRAKLKYPILQTENSEWLEVVPKEHRKQLIEEHHAPPTCGHAGIFKTFNRIATKYYWPKLKADVTNYIRRCNICLETKPDQKQPAGLMLSKTPTVSRPWQLVSTDIVGPLPRSSGGYSYILSVCDCFSKFVLLFPLRKATSINVTKLLEEQVILIFGAPNRIITDNGAQFRSRLFREKMQEYNIKISYTANYHPQANPVERIHRVVKTMLSSYVKDKQKLWDKFLPKIGWAIRSAKHEITNLTPNFITFGREIQIYGDQQPAVGEQIIFNRQRNEQDRGHALEHVFEDVQKRLQAAYNKSKVSYDLRHRDERFGINQKVWKRNFVLSDATKQFTSKLASKFTGPFTVYKIVSPYTYELVDDSGRNVGVWHSKDLKAHPPDQDIVN